MNTKFELEYALKDLTAIADSTPETTDNQSFADISLLKTGVSMASYMTLEDGFTALDGTFQPMPDSPNDISFWSNEISNKNGYFATEQSVTILFTGPHTSIGLTFYFSEVAPSQFKVNWYNDADTIMSEKVFNVETIEQMGVSCIKYFAANQVSDYYKIKIEFIKTKPYHFIKMCYLEYGADVIYSDDTVKKATLVEETNANSEKISVNSLEVSIMDKANDFNLGNADGLHASLQQKQYMKAYEWVDSNRIYLGKYYLSDFSTQDNVTKLNCISIVGLMDNFEFLDGGIYNGEPAINVIDAIMSTCGITGYTVDAETSATLLYGTIGKMSCRNAIKEVLFATNSHLKTSRLDSIEIKKENVTIGSTIGPDRKFSTRPEKREYVSSVAIKYKAFKLSATISEIFKDTLPSGVSLVEFTEPVGTISASVGTILVQKPYYCIISLATSAEVTITGYKYESSEFTVSKSLDVIKQGEIEKIKTFSSSLVTYQTALALCDKLLEYYSRPLKLTTRFVNMGEESGRYAIVKNPDTRYNDYVAGIERMTTDLTGGFITNAECVGYYQQMTQEMYAGEFYAGEEYL